MQTLYHKMEFGVGVLGLMSTPFFFTKYPELYTVSLAEVFKWSGILLLGQGLIRDLVLVIFYRHLLQHKKQTSSSVVIPNDSNATGNEQKTADPSPNPQKKGLWLCLESTLGVLLIAIYFLQDLSKSQVIFHWATGYWILAISLWWLFGYFTREFVLELKRDPNHLNLIIGF